MYIQQFTNQTSKQTKKKQMNLKFLQSQNISGMFKVELFQGFFTRILRCSFFLHEVSSLLDLLQFKQLY